MNAPTGPHGFSIGFVIALAIPAMVFIELAVWSVLALRRKL